MFAVYDATGRSFKNTLEELKRVKRVYRGTGVRGRQEQEEEGGPEPSFASALSRRMIEVYKQAVPVKRESTIYHAVDVMTKPVVTVRDDYSPERCWEALVDNDVSQLPVMDDQGRLIGILTERDLLKEMVVDGRDIIRTTGKVIIDIMSPQVVTTDPVSDIRRVAKVLYDYHFNALPVVDDNDILVGIITRSDIIKAVATIPALSLWV